MTMSASLVMAYLCVLVGLVQITAGQRQLCGRVLADTLDLVCAGRGFHLGKRNGRSVGMVYGKVQNQPTSAEKRNKLHSTPSTTDSTADLKLDSPKDFTTMLKSRILVKTLGSAAISVEKSVESGVQNGLETAKSISSVDVDDEEVDGAALRRRRNVESRSIVNECCLQACTFATLESYCAASDDPDQVMSMNEMRLHFGMGPNRQPSRTHLPSAENQQQANARHQPSAQINRGQSRDNSFFYLSIGQQATRSPLLDKRNS